MVEPVVSRPAWPRGWRVEAGPGARATAASGTLESGSGPVSFSHPPPRTFLLSTDMARHSGPLHLSLYMLSSETA